MITPIDKGRVLVPPPDKALTRRNFFDVAATLTTGVAAAGIFPTPTLAAKAKQKGRALPRAMAAGCNLRTDGFVTSVKNQNDPNDCNSCTAFAVVATVECTYNKRNNLPGAQGPDLDEKDLFTQALPGPVDGCATTHWWPKFALAYCLATGLKWEQGTNPRIIAAPKYLIGKNLSHTQKNIKDHICDFGPVVAVMVQYRDFFYWGEHWRINNLPNTENPNVYFPGAPLPGKPGGNPVEPEEIVGGHVVSIVGYSGNEYWICKNSWGDKWNGDGFVNIAQGKGMLGETYIDCVDVWGTLLHGVLA
jgi:hypothetical protein